jgi:hypothetical protein
MVSESFVDDLLCIEVIGTGNDFSGQDAAVEGADDSDALPATASSPNSLRSWAVPVATDDPARLSLTLSVILECRG